MDRRSRVIARVQRVLSRRGLPRLQMTLVVAATGLAGFGVSVALLRLGLMSMPVRYPLAVLAAYAVFMFVIRLWVGARRRGLRHDPGTVDLPSNLPSVRVGGHTHEPSPFDGGTFGGGGVQRSWESAALHPGAVPAGDLPQADSSAASPGGVDLDEVWVILIPLMVLAACAVAAVWVIYTAPALLAELLVDAALVSGLYRRLRRLEPQSWFTVALRRTWVPFTAVFLSFAVGGAIVQSLAPQAHSIGDLLRLFTE